MNIDWSGWIALAVSLLTPAVVWFARNWIAAWIEKRVQHGFDQKIESLRSELRRQEEAFRSELRSKEAEIEALRGSVLSGMAQRQALLDKRRIEAVDRFWSAFAGLARYKAAVMQTSMFKLDAIATEVARNEKVRLIFKVMADSYPDPQFPDPARNEQPFISPLAWAYFSTYQTVVYLAHAEIKVLALGENPERLLNLQAARDVVKSALPHYAEYVDKWGVHVSLLDELENRLLEELRRTLEGTELDAESLARSANIMKQVEGITLEREGRLTKAKMTNAGAPPSVTT
jgi:hypothetical protein